MPDHIHPHPMERNPGLRQNHLPTPYREEQDGAGQSPRRDRDRSRDMSSQEPWKGYS